MGTEDRAMPQSERTPSLREKREELAKALADIDKLDKANDWIRDKHFEIKVVPSSIDGECPIVLHVHCIDNKTKEDSTKDMPDEVWKLIGDEIKNITGSVLRRITDQLRNAEQTIRVLGKTL
jgi:hypothetical protein